MPPARLVLAGAPVSNDNRGVEALGRAVIGAALRSASDVRVSVLDSGWGTRPDTSGAYPEAGVEYVGVRRSRRWHRRESWARIRFDQALGGMGNPVVGKLAQADAVLDISGGDSFTDLYGRGRLLTVSAPKEAAIRAGRPLVLLPQTFGPFRTTDGRRRAERLVRLASLAYSRDAWSHEQLLALAGEDADRSRLRTGVDVAFALARREPSADVVERLTSLGDVVVGVNVSGLLVPRGSGDRFGIAGNYLATMTSLVRRLVGTGAFVVLVPHVSGTDPTDSDLVATDAVLSALAAAEQPRVWALPGRLRADELKWCIAKLDWFAGSRMHSTIASLSSRVPSFAYAYSDKTRGVFETCGVADQVADAREVTGAALVERALHSFGTRAEIRRRLEQRVPAVVARSREQLDEIFGEVRSWSAAQPATRG